jgi:hypothetical protein
MFTGLKRLAARFIYKSVSYSIRDAYESGATGRARQIGKHVRRAAKKRNRSSNGTARSRSLVMRDRDSTENEVQKLGTD